MSHLVGRPRLSTLALLLALMALPITASAFTGAEQGDPEATTEESGRSWGPIVGACLGVMFGGALALWQIRGMRNRD